MSSSFEKQIALADDINFLLSKIRIAFASQALYLKYGIQTANNVTVSKLTQSAIPKTVPSLIGQDGSSNMAAAAAVGAVDPRIPSDRLEK